MIGLYTKAIAAAVVAAGTTAITALQDGRIQHVEWATIAGAFLVALGAVWAIPNVPEPVRKYGKAVTSALVAAAAAVVTALLSGEHISQDEWVTIGIALITGAGLVAIAPNAARSDDAYDPNDLPSDEPGNGVGSFPE